MNIYYAQDEVNFENSIFLMGPSPRDENTKSWRKEAIELFEKIEKEYDFTINLVLPEFKDGNFNFEKEDQIKWELNCQNNSTILFFWIPREMKKLPGLTTNIELGMNIDRKNLVIGFPKNSEKNEYIKILCKIKNIPLFNSLENQVRFVFEKIKNEKELDSEIFKLLNNLQVGRNAADKIFETFKGS